MPIGGPISERQIRPRTPIQRKRRSMKEPFSVALAAFMARYKRRSLTERINALREQTMVLELDRDAKMQRDQDEAYGRQLLAPRPQ